MRMLLHARFPTEPFNRLCRDGSAGKLIQEIVAAQKPEAVYFTEWDGQRSALLVIDLKEASQIPVFAEPWFLKFGAACQFRVVMSPEDLGKAGLDALGARWG